MKTAAIASIVLAMSMVAPRARASDPDPWLGKDKAAHFAASTVITGGGYTLGALAWDTRGRAILTGAAFGVFAGVAKESLDLAGLGDPSWKDLTWDGIGVVTGLAVSLLVDWIVRPHVPF